MRIEALISLVVFTLIFLGVALYANKHRAEDHPSEKKGSDEEC